MLSEGIDFNHCSNAILKCSDSGNLQELALIAQDLLSCGQKWLACLTSFFKESERKVQSRSRSGSRTYKSGDHQDL